ncbi:MAG: glycosyl hydrolase [Kiritimatiellaeota bacterium]|nr:glycosyl hydrolase [Kiritimatiellota bacterium]
MKNWIMGLSYLACAGVLKAQTPFNATLITPDVELAQHFKSPPASARPWVFWEWVGLSTSTEAITKDLEEMHAKGIEGVMLFQNSVKDGKMTRASGKMELRGKEYEVVPSKDYPDAHITKFPGQELVPWSPQSRVLLRHVARESRRLGIKFSLTVGLASTSGAIAPGCGQQKLMWSETAVVGPKDFDTVIPVPATDVPATLEPSTHVSSRRPSVQFACREVAVLAVPDKPGITASDVINLAGKLDVTGHLCWQVPAGKWTILRFGFTPTGAKNPWGYYTDGMSAEALDKTWDVTIGPLLQEMSPGERQGLYAVVDDSWEAGVSTWTKLFATEFQKRRGYDLLPWLPVLTGKNIGGVEATEKARRDYYRTIADLIAQNHYAHLRELANRNGLFLYAEAAGPNSGQLDDMQNSGNVDVAMGEFWIPSVHRPTPPRRFMLRDAASANHIYGKRITPCEAFTSIGPVWEESFFDLKNVADQAFCDGLNLIVFHNYSHSPSLTAKPGYCFYPGTHYNRNVTWWEQTPAFNAYVDRCSYLLQQGLFVAATTAISTCSSTGSA